MAGTRQQKIMLAMTSIAVTASICASASEAALLVASFMPFSLDPGVTHRCARERARRPWFTRNPPRRVFALIESPLSEHRPCQGRIVMRRHFDSLVARLANLSPRDLPTKTCLAFDRAADFARQRKPLIQRRQPDIVLNGNWYSISGVQQNRNGEVNHSSIRLLDPAHASEP